MESFSNSILSIKYIFGINDIKNNIQLLDSNKIFYVAGHYIVKYNIEENIQQFIKVKENENKIYQEITCFCLSRKKNLILFSERSKKPCIFLFDTGNLKEKKIIKLPENFPEKINAYSIINFSNENDFLCTTLSEGENAIIFLWNIETKKLLKYIKIYNNFIIKEIKFDVSDLKVSVIGENTFKIYEIEHGKILKDNTKLPLEDSYNFTSHIWHLENIFLANTKGEILILDNNGNYLDTIMDENKENRFSIICIKNYKDGFLVSGSNFNLIQYEYVENKYVKTRSIFYDNCDQKEISLIDFVIDDELEDKIISLGNNKTFYSGKLAKKDDSDLYEKEIKPIFNQGHLSDIYSLDISIRKSLFATCSKDKTVKIWNYLTKTLENNISFTEEPLSVAIHPSGFYIAVSFTDKVKVLNLFSENAEHKSGEISLKGCKEVKFSNGGHLLAIVSGNPQLIYIQKFYNLDKVSEIILKGHSGKIKYIEFSKDDLYLYSFGYDGSLFEWKLSDLARNEIIKGHPINDVALSNDDKFYLVKQDQNSLVEYSDKKERKHKDNSIFSTIAITNNNKMIFAGIQNDINNNYINSGCIKYFRNPIKSNLDNNQIIFAHNYWGIDKLRINFNDQYLISIGKDTSICVFEIKDKESKGIPLKEGYPYFSKEILIKKQEIEEFKSKKDQLNNSKLDDPMHNTNTLNINQLEEKIKRLKDLIQNNENKEIKEIKSLNKQLDNLVGSKDSEVINLSKKNEEEIRELEHHFNKELSKETERIDQMRSTIKTLENQYEEELNKINEDNYNKIIELENKNQNELNEKENKKAKILEEINKLEENHFKKLEIIKKDIKNEEKSLKSDYKTEIKNLDEEISKTRNNLKKNVEKQQKIEKKNKDYEETKKEYNQKLDILKNTLNELKFKIKEQINEMNSKNKKITEKEKKIYDLKKTTQELEKYKFVLDFKIKDLKKDIAPRELEIIKLKKKISEQDNQLKKYNSYNSDFTKIVKTLDKEVGVLTEKIDKQKKKILEKNSRIKKWQKNVFDSIQLIQNYDELKKKILSIKLLKKKKIKVNQNIIKESDMQIKYLGKTVNMMKKNLERDTLYHNKEKMGIMKGNAKLIKEIREIREKLKEFKTTDKKDIILLKKKKLKKKKQLEPINENSSLEEERKEIKKFEKKIIEQNKEIYNLRTEIDLLNIKNN